MPDVTVVRRKDGTPWPVPTSTVLVNALKTIVSTSPKHPDTLILWGKHVAADVSRASLAPEDNLSVEVLSMDDPRLPFDPRGGGFGF